MNKFTRVPAGFADGFMAAQYHRALGGATSLANIGLTRQTILRRPRELARAR